MRAGLLRLALLVQVFRLSFGPKSFVVVSDAEVARYMLMTNAGNYTKGVLSEILDFVMGKGGPPSAHGHECTLQCSPAHEYSITINTVVTLEPANIHNLASVWKWLACP